MLKDFDYFVQFCIEHGGSLHNHIAFVKMAQELHSRIKDINMVTILQEQELEFKIKPWSDFRDDDGKLIYTYPYTNKCGKCGEESMEGDKCKSCGYSYHQVACPRCGIFMHHDYTNDGTKQCSLYCDVRDEQDEKERLRKLECERINNPLSYPEEIRKIVKILFPVFDYEWKSFDNIQKIAYSILKLFKE